MDLIPTLLGLTGIDTERAAAGVAAHHTEARPLPGRDLSGLLTGKASAPSVATPIYFMTEDDVTRGLNDFDETCPGPWEWDVKRLAASAGLVIAWGVAQWPYILPTSLKVAEAAAPSGTLTALLVATAGFALIVLPAFVLLYVLDQKSLLPEESVA